MRTTPIAPASSRSARGRPRATTRPAAMAARSAAVKPSPCRWRTSVGRRAAGRASGRRATDRPRSRWPARPRRGRPGAASGSTGEGDRRAFGTSPVQYGPFRPSAIVVPRAARRAGRSRPSCGYRSLRSSSDSGGDAGGGPASGRAGRPASPAPPDVYVHTIAPRDTLIAVSRTLLADPRGWPLLQRLNRVRNPRRLRPGRTLDIPIDLLRTVPASAEVLWVRGGPRVRSPTAPTSSRCRRRRSAEGARVTTQAGEAVGLRLTTGADADDRRERRRRPSTSCARIPAANAARTGLDLRRGRIQNAVPPATRRPALSRSARRS